jgi:hypothetical protein
MNAKPAPRFTANEQVRILAPSGLAGQEATVLSEADWGASYLVETKDGRKAWLHAQDIEKSG